MNASRLKIAAVQMKFRPATAANVEWMCEVIAQAGHAGDDVVLFPECATTGYARDFHALRPAEIQSAIGALSETTRRAGCHVLFGSPSFHGGKLFNSLMVLNRRGKPVYEYSKVHLTSRDRAVFARGNHLAFFKLDGVLCTAIICHERRYPELVRLPVMLGAQILFHPNAGLDRLAISKTKRDGRDGIVARAFENQIYYVFANSVGPQGGGLWSAGDSKIVAPDLSMLALADNTNERVIRAEVDVTRAQRQYARDALRYPAFLRKAWKDLLRACRGHVKRT